MLVSAAGPRAIPRWRAGQGRRSAPPAARRAACRATRFRGAVRARAGNRRSRLRPDARRARPTSWPACRVAGRSPRLATWAGVARAARDVPLAAIAKVPRCGGEGAQLESRRWLRRSGDYPGCSSVREPITDLVVAQSCDLERLGLPPPIGNRREDLECDTQLSSYRDDVTRVRGLAHDVVAVASDELRPGVVAGVVDDVRRRVDELLDGPREAAVEALEQLGLVAEQLWSWSIV